MVVVLHRQEFQGILFVCATLICMHEGLHESVSQAENVLIYMDVHSNGSTTCKFNPLYTVCMFIYTFFSRRSLDLRVYVRFVTTRM